MDIAARAFQRIRQHNTKKSFIMEAADGEAAKLTNVLNSIGGITTNLIDTVSRIEAAKRDKKGEDLDKAFDDLREQLDSFNLNCRTARDEMKLYLKPMIKNG